MKLLSKKQFIDNFKKLFINEKKENQEYSYGCIMGYFDANPMDLLKNKDEFEIDENDIYNNEENEYGKELDGEWHVTVLYGLHDTEIDDMEIVNMLRTIKMPTVKFTGISSFNNDEYDVLKWDIENKTLHYLNEHVRETYPYTNKFNQYIPHSTIAYLKSGKAEKYTKNLPEHIINLPIKRWVYSTSKDNKYYINDDGIVEIIDKDNNSKYLVEGKRTYKIQVGKMNKEASEKLIEETLSKMKEEMKMFLPTK